MDIIISRRTIKPNTSLTPGAPDQVRAEYRYTYIYTSKYICTLEISMYGYYNIGGVHPHYQAKHLAHARHPGPGKGRIYMYINIYI